MTSAQLPAKNARGFTLLEVVLYVSLIGLLLWSVSDILTVMQMARIKSQIIARVEQEGAESMLVISQAVRNARQILIPASAASADTLSLRSYDAALDPVSIDLAGGRLRIAEGAAAPVALNSSRVAVSGVRFTNLSRGNAKGTVRIEFTVTFKNSSGRSEYEYSKTFYGTATAR